MRTLTPHGFSVINHESENTMDVNPVDLLIGSAVMPPVIALLNQRSWAPPLKGIIALVACLIAAVVVEFVRGPVALTGWRDTAIVVAGTAFASYKLWWQPAGVAPAIEGATSPGGRSPEGQQEPGEGQHA
jgi:hypothetical protein